MNNVTYEKPSMKFVSIRNEESVANTCWGGHGGSLTWNYDTSGLGYVSFQIGGGKCTLNLMNVKYHEKYQDEGIVLSSGDSKYKELEAALMESGGESGNPFKGEGIEFPTDPDPSWS